MRLRPIASTLVSGGMRRTGYRPVLRHAGRTVWRCGCTRPHSTAEVAEACGNVTLGARGSGYFRGREYMSEWLPTTEARTHTLAVIDALQSLPTTVEAAIGALLNLREEVMAAETEAEVRDKQAWTEWVRAKFKDIREVREMAERVFLTGEWSIAQRLPAAAIGGRPITSGLGPEVFTEDRAPTHREIFGGDPKYSWRLRQIQPLAIEALDSAISEFHRVGQEATLTGIVKRLRAGESEERRLNSMTAPRIAATPPVRASASRRTSMQPPAAAATRLRTSFTSGNG